MKKRMGCISHTHINNPPIHMVGYTRSYCMCSSSSSCHTHTPSSSSSSLVLGETIFSTSSPPKIKIKIYCVSFAEDLNTTTAPPPALKKTELAARHITHVFYKNLRFFFFPSKHQWVWVTPI